MGGRRGGDPVRRQGKQRGQTPWFAPSVRILAAIGKTTRPDLEAVGRETRKLLKGTEDDQPATA